MRRWGQHVNPAGGAVGSRTTEHAGLQPTPLPLGYGASLLFSSVSLRPVEAFHLKMTSSASSTPCTSAPWINKCLPRTRSFSVPPSNFVPNDAQFAASSENRHGVLYHHTRKTNLFVNTLQVCHVMRIATRQTSSSNICRLNMDEGRSLKWRDHC